MLSTTSMLFFEKLYTVETMPIDTIIYFVRLEDICALKNDNKEILILLDREAPVYAIYAKAMMPQETMVGIVRVGKTHTQNDYELVIDHLFMAHIGIEILERSDILDDDENIEDDFIVFHTHVSIDNDEDENATQQTISTSQPTYQQLQTQLAELINEQKFEAAAEIREKINTLYPDRV